MLQVQQNENSVALHIQVLLYPIGECGDFSDGHEETLTADELSPFESEPTELRQDVIEKVKNNVKRTSINRITIRRREAF